MLYQNGLGNRFVSGDKKHKNREPRVIDLERERKGEIDSEPVTVTESLVYRRISSVPSFISHTIQYMYMLMCVCVCMLTLGITFILKLKSGATTLPRGGHVVNNIGLCLLFFVFFFCFSLLSIYGKLFSV